MNSNMAGHRANVVCHNNTWTNKYQTQWLFLICFCLWSHPSHQLLTIK